MDRAALAATVAGVALLLLPVVYFGELGAWAFAEPVSNLDWDEGGLRPEQAGGTPAGSGGSGGGGDGASPESTDSTGGSGGSGADSPPPQQAQDDSGGGSGGSGGSGSDPQPAPQEDAGGGSGASGASGGSGSGASQDDAASPDGGSGPGGSGSGETGGSGGSGAALGVAGSGPEGSGGNQTGSGAFGSQGSAPAFHWPAFTFGSLSFLVILGGCAWWWGNAYAVFWIAFAHAMAAWAVAFWLALALLLCYVLWAYLGILGGIVAAGVALTLVYLNSQGALFGGAATSAGPGTPPAPPSGEPKVVQRMPKRPR